MTPGSGFSHGVSRKPGRLLNNNNSDVTPAYMTLRGGGGGGGGGYTSLADCGNNMKRNDLNKSMFEELFRGPRGCRIYGGLSRII